MDRVSPTVPVSPTEPLSAFTSNEERPPPPVFITISKLFAALGEPGPSFLISMVEPLFSQEMPAEANAALFAVNAASSAVAFPLWLELPAPVKLISTPSMAKATLSPDILLKLLIVAVV